MLEQGKSQQALELVKKSDREIISSYSILYNTGSDTADAILSERLKQLTKEVKLRFSGNLTKLPEDNFDICVLLNNTIDIALFSLQSITSDGEKLIEISAMCKQGVLLYKISFPCENNGFFDDLQSSKDDMLKMNILRKLTDKNDGKMDTHIENQIA